MIIKQNRRQFLGAAVGTTVVGWAGAKLYAAGAGLSPNETVNIGVVGCGNRAAEVLGRFKSLPNNRVVAVCDVNEKRRKTLSQGKLPDHGDFRKVIDDKNVDVVLIATQAHWHVLPMIEA